ncbi:hypothetical protein H6S82_05525 [Planktothrix sp. FACHB-1355]|uniref:Uncharacterized protein n=1 Tax=Aerosakkonema funiforme FACHB-1375 TaxID=2949571 RepID=A0A926VB50_9CYAN|nr:MULTISPECIES: hypothetical protein [Oscillatoriales]MBD2180619.1 hypothetical protein [Aerosakkonema funiforme FACHB-1375]MBD3558316.1 hypothetical protein [Planktothrix sp. FACHB-1355]
MEVNEAANVLAREVTTAALWGICATSIGAVGGAVTAASIAVSNNAREPLAPTICGTITGTILGAALALIVIFNKKRSLCSD